MPRTSRPRSRKRGKGKKGRRKGKKKGKKKGNKLPPEPPPLHLLTELYNKLDDATIELYEMRIAMRKKRLETWYMMMQISEAKLKNRIFKDYIEGKMNDLQEAIDRLLKLIQAEKDAIADAIKKLTDEYDRQIQEYNKRSDEIEQELANIKLLLVEFEPMMAELDRLLARLEQLKREIEEAQQDASLKIRHLTNQFLEERGRLHNHLEEQLCELIRHCRTYMMPILWNFMQRLIARNACSRWKLARTDEKNIALAEEREELIRRRKLLTIEKPYWNIDWALHRIADDAKKKKQLEVQSKDFKTNAIREMMVGKTDQELALLTMSGGVTNFHSTISGGTLLGREFNKFLIQRLTAASEAQARAQKSHKKEKKRFLETILETAAEERRKTIIRNSIYYDDDDDFDLDLWDDMEDESDEDEEDEDSGEEEDEDEEEEDEEDEEVEYEDEEDEEEDEEETDFIQRKSLLPDTRKSINE